MSFDVELIRNGIHSGNLEDWLAFNRTGAFESQANLDFVAPFPPEDRMQITTGLKLPRDFAAHGDDIFRALSQASPRPLSSFTDVLDFGVGAGRLARLFKGFQGRYTGIDVDSRNIAWVSRALNHVNAIKTEPRKRLPFADRSFDLIISISVFSHINEKDQMFYLSEIARVAKPGAVILLSIHGDRALERAETEPGIFTMLTIPRGGVTQARQAFNGSGFHFVRQWTGHLNNLFYAYGITFISRKYVERVWSRLFDDVRVNSGVIHDFQDIVVATAR